MLVEDLHWADPTTLDLVGYLALALGDHRALIVTTDRGDAADEALRRFRAPLRRVDRLVDLRLSALAPDDVAELVRASLGGDPPAPLLDLLAARASGIPLYVTAFVAALREQGRLARSGDRWVLRPGDDTALPSSVVDVVAVRLDELPGADVDLLAAVAVCGDAATADMLCAVSNLPDVPARLDTLAGSGLVDERSDGAVPVYRPHHPLVADVAYRRLSSGERRQRQAAAASYLVENDIADRRRTAHHVRLAGPAFDPEQALDILAADSTDVGDDDLPAAQAMVALARAAGRSDLVATGLRRVAEAATLAGDVPTAITAWQDAADAAEDPVRRSRALRRLALVQFESGDSVGAERSIDDAVAALPPGATAIERFAVEQQRMTFRARHRDVTLDDYVWLRDLALQAGLAEGAAIFDEFRSHRETLNALTMPVAGSDMIRIAESLMAAWGLDADPTVTSQWQNAWVMDAIVRGELAEGSCRARRAEVAADAAKSPGARLTISVLDGFADWLTGDWDCALLLAGEALVVAHRIANNRAIALALAFRGLVLMHRGAVEQARSCVADARASYVVGDPHAAGTVDTVDAVIAVEQGDATRALAILDRATPINHLGLVALQTRAKASAAVGDRERVQQAAADIAAVEGRWAAALARQVLAWTAPAEEATGRLAASIADYDTLGMIYEAARCRLDRAETFPKEPTFGYGPRPTTRMLPSQCSIGWVPRRPPTARVGFSGGSAAGRHRARAPAPR